ncbi:LutC/YkgG family protein [Nocardiopsis baichengensis]|uniref:LutC/YkgG family protein n=1 Tax=Nocardiopsis baichengensis TaxID=280240 RepID=UPI000345A0E6|nr:lactate utilization protein C [Nocardiopsis baichengensis]
MSAPLGSRERVLAKVRAALADVPRDEDPGDAPVPRDYARTHRQGPALDLLVDRLEDYRAQVRRVRGAELPAAVAEALERRGAARVAVPGDAPGEWFSRSGAEVLRDAPWEDRVLSVPELDAVDGAVTGCAVAVAETGTIILDTGEHQGRRALTLVPDYHLCVVRARQVVDGVPEAVERLDPVLPQTWISGPSATSDIELERVEGVHGPRTLEVLLVE